MTNDANMNEVVALLREMRDRQNELAATTQRLEDLLRKQAEQTSTRVAESIELQKVAITRQRNAFLLGVPLVLLCLALIMYLIATFL